MPENTGLVPRETGDVSNGESQKEDEDGRQRLLTIPARVVTDSRRLPPRTLETPFNQVWH